MQPTDSELIQRWQGEPAPLLPLLHAFHERDGYLSDDALRAVSQGLRIPLAELFGTVSFYHHFSREPGGHGVTRVCSGPICKLRGSDELIEELEGAHSMACSGRCDEPIGVLRGGEALVGHVGGELGAQPTPLPAPNPGGVEECCFRSIRVEGRGSIEGYRRSGGYRALEKARAMGGEALLGELEASGLAGRGGAGFPTARKWRAVREAPGGPKTVVCNADEGEPGCFKDRALLDHDPHAVIEGIAIAALATGATRAFIYLRYEYPWIQEKLERAIVEARDELGELAIHVRRGAGAYICGEETALLSSLEGEHPFPRNRPPYPVTCGFEGTPTAVNNVETLASVPPILDLGAQWYAGLGLAGHKGTKLISLSGDVRRPGNYEVPMGLPLDTLLHEWAGGPLEGRRIEAVTMAGLSGGFLGRDDFDVTLDEPALRAKGSFLGAGGIMVFDDSRDIFAVAREAMAFFADESCGKCFPCRIGTRRLTERLSGEGPTDPSIWKEEVEAIGRTMSQVSACGLGIAAPLITTSLMRLFPDAVDAHLKRP